VLDGSVLLCRAASVFIGHLLLADVEILADAIIANKWRKMLDWLRGRG